MIRRLISAQVLLLVCGSLKSSQGSFTLTPQSNLVATPVDEIIDESKTKESMLDTRGSREKNQELDAPGSPVRLFMPDEFQFYTLNNNGQLIMKQMTKKEIQSLIAAGSASNGHLPIELGHHKFQSPTVEGDPKVSDVVQNVRKVLKDELYKPHPAETLGTSIPGSVNSQWSDILPYILSGSSMNQKQENTPDNVFVPQLEIDQTYINTTPLTNSKPLIKNQLNEAKINYMKTSPTDMNEKVKLVTKKTALTTGHGSPISMIGNMVIDHGIFKEDNSVETLSTIPNPSSMVSLPILTISSPLIASIKDNLKNSSYNKPTLYIPSLSNLQNKNRLGSNMHKISNEEHNKTSMIEHVALKIQTPATISQKSTVIKSTKRPESSLHQSVTFSPIHELNDKFTSSDQLQTTSNRLLHEFVTELTVASSPSSYHPIYKPQITKSSQNILNTVISSSLSSHTIETEPGLNFPLPESFHSIYESITEPNVGLMMTNYPIKTILTSEASSSITNLETQVKIDDQFLQATKYPNSQWKTTEKLVSNNELEIKSDTLNTNSKGVQNADSSNLQNLIFSNLAQLDGNDSSNQSSQLSSKLKVEGKNDFATTKEPTADITHSYKQSIKSFISSTEKTLLNTSPMSSLKTENEESTFIYTKDSNTFKQEQTKNIVDVNKFDMFLSQPTETITEGTSTKFNDFKIFFKQEETTSYLEKFEQNSTDKPIEITTYDFFKNEDTIDNFKMFDNLDNFSKLENNTNLLLKKLYTKKTSNPENEVSENPDSGLDHIKSLTHGIENNDSSTYSSNNNKNSEFLDPLNQTTLEEPVTEILKNSQPLLNEAPSILTFEKENALTKKNQSSILILPKLENEVSTVKVIPVYDDNMSIYTESIKTLSNSAILGEPSMKIVKNQSKISSTIFSASEDNPFIKSIKSTYDQDGYSSQTVTSDYSNTLQSESFNSYLNDHFHSILFTTDNNDDKLGITSIAPLDYEGISKNKDNANGNFSLTKNFQMTGENSPKYNSSEYLTESTPEILSTQKINEITQNPFEIQKIIQTVESNLKEANNVESTTIYVDLTSSVTNMQTSVQQIISNNSNKNSSLEAKIPVLITENIEVLPSQLIRISNHAYNLSKKFEDIHKESTKGYSVTNKNDGKKRFNFKNTLAVDTALEKNVHNAALKNDSIIFTDIHDTSKNLPKNQIINLKNKLISKSTNNEIKTTLINTNIESNSQNKTFLDIYKQFATEKPVIMITNSSIKEAHEKILSSIDKTSNRSNLEKEKTKAPETFKLTVRDKDYSHIFNKTVDIKFQNNTKKITQPTFDESTIINDSKSSIEKTTNEKTTVQLEGEFKNQSHKITVVPQKIISAPEVEKFLVIPEKEAQILNTKIVSELDHKKLLFVIQERVHDSNSHIVTLDHSSGAIGLDQSNRALDKDIAEFLVMCNELSFKFWSFANSRLTSSRSMTLSTFGMISTLSMIYLGARGITSNQMNDILKLDDVVTFNPHLVFQNITDTVTLGRGHGIENAAFVRALFADRLKVRKIIPFYKEQAQQFYEGAVVDINFSTAGDILRRRTNLLIRKQTGGKIKDFMKTHTVPLRSPLTALSANIFQTSCDSLDISSEGRDGEMYFAVSQAVKQRKLVPIPAIVWKSGVSAGYEPSLDATAIALGDSKKPVSFIMVMPGQQGLTAPGDNLERLENRLFSNPMNNSLDKLLKVIIPRRLEIQMPKFSHRSVINVTSALKKMGFGQLFTKSADLKGINGAGHDFYLADMLQINLFCTCGENKLSGHPFSETYTDTVSRHKRAWKTFDSHRLENNFNYKRSEKFKSRENIKSEKGLNLDPMLKDTAYKMLDQGLNKLKGRKFVGFFPVTHKKYREKRQTEPGKSRMKIDKPFLYLIRHNLTGLILYIGRFNPKNLS